MIKHALSIFSVLIFLAANASALTMEEAVRIARENNHTLKQYRYIEQSKREAAGKSRAGFLPALDFGYSYGVHEEENSPTGRELSTVTLVATYNLFNGKSDEKNFLRAKALAEAEEGRRESAEADTVLAVKEA
ncbi:MAG: TolC family protein, partial [Desulfobacterales bacterium]|nr:TolC family protein [Desulfobacterales bacterium]